MKQTEWVFFHNQLWKMCECQLKITVPVCSTITLQSNVINNNYTTSCDLLVKTYSGGFWDLSAAVNSVCKTFSLAPTSSCDVFLSYLSRTPQSNQSRGYEVSQPTFQWLHCWRAVVVFLGHLIRQWAPSMNCRSTSKAMWQHLIVTTRRDMPGRCSAMCSGRNNE